ncbi:MAG: MarR family transcriptional regulator [Alphaproteobacteria bacterium]|nr:MarR family transcriptional regulator [Alphaproteobacteria bacterium]
MPDSPLFSDLPGHLLRRCHQISVALFLDECSRFDITPLQFAVLSTLIEYGPKDQASIGGLAALDRTTVAVVLRNLEGRQLVRRVQSQKDKRAKITSITERGRRLIADVTPLVKRVQTRSMAPLEPQEVADLTRLLGKMTKANNSLSRAPMRVQKYDD